MPDNGSPPRNPLASRLAQKATVDIEGKTAHWRCRVLSPTEAVELQAGLSMLQSAVEAAARGDEADPPMPTPQQQVVLVRHMEAVACAVVIESSESGKKWLPIRLVNTLEQQDVEIDPPRVYIGTIDASDIGQIAFAATATYREGRAAAAPFRGGSDAPKKPRRSRAKVRKDAR